MGNEHDKRGRQGIQGHQGIEGIEGHEGDRGPRGPAGADSVVPGPQGEPGKYEAIHKWRWHALTAWIIVFSFLSAYSVQQNRERSAEGIRATQALCRVKHNLEARIQRTEEFLKANSEPILFGTVPRELLLEGLQDDKHTVRDFDVLNCPPVKL